MRKQEKLVLIQLKCLSFSFQEKKTSNVKYEDSDSDDDLESLSNFLSGPSTMTTPMTRRSAGGMLDLSELDPVEELAAEHLEDSP